MFFFKKEGFFLKIMSYETSCVVSMFIYGMAFICLVCISISFMIKLNDAKYIVGRIRFTGILFVIFVCIHIGLHIIYYMIQYLYDECNNEYSTLIQIKIMGILMCIGMWLYRNAFYVHLLSRLHYTFIDCDSTEYGVNIWIYVLLFIVALVPFTLCLTSNIYLYYQGYSYSLFDVKTFSIIFSYAILVIGDFIVNFSILYIFASNLLHLTVNLYETPKPVCFSIYFVNVFENLIYQYIHNI